MKLKALSVILCLMVLFGVFTTTSFADQQILITIDGIPVQFNEQTGYPFLDKNNRIQVPFRATLEAFGAEVGWDGQQRAAIAKKENIKVEVRIGEPYIIKNDRKILNDTEALIKDGRTYLPIRAVMEAFNCVVGWDGQFNTVQINTEVFITPPPFHGTIFIDPNIVDENDSTSFVDLSYKGMGKRTMFDRRFDDWINIEVFLFEAKYDNGSTIEIQVNPEFKTIKDAQEQALRFAIPIGQLPAILRSGVETVWIHKGFYPFGGGNNNILIHTDQADEYMEMGILEEALIHEGTHSSLDPAYANSKEWKAAQELDGTFISEYARDNAGDEDLAESYITYLAIKFCSKRISYELLETITKTIPNRIMFFEKQNFDMHPFK